MDHGFEGWVADHCLVEGALDSDVFDYGEGELVADLGVGLFDLVGFGLGADGCDDGVALLEEEIEDVGGDEAAAAGK